MVATVLRSIAFLWIAAAAAFAQDLVELRYDLGERLRRFERAWAAATPEAAEQRAQATAAMRRAVQAFFALDLGRAARELDDGYAGLVGMPADTRRLLSLGVVPSKRLLPLDAAVELTIAPSYDGEAWPDELRPRIWTGLVTGDLRTTVGSGGLDMSGRQIPYRRGLEVPPQIGEGDFIARVRILLTDRWSSEAAEDWLEVGAVGVSFARDLVTRIEDLRFAARAAREPALEAETLRHLHRLLAGMARGGAVETDLPAFRLLCEAEQVATAIADREPFYSDDRPGQFWLRVPTLRRSLPVRVLVPARAGGEREPRPLVLALHGAGGSENLFFDGYGDGLVARLAAERGWYLCAPRALSAGSAEALVDSLARRFAIDRSRVYCVGHSMGAMTAVDAAQRFPGLFAGVAPLGGGGRVTDGEAIEDLPFLVGAGELDFALGGARGLARALDRAGVDAELKVYPGVEHMLIVQVALPDVFAFFER